MFQKKIVRVGEKAYTLGAYLSRGLIGTVYPAWEYEKGKETEILPSQKTHGLPDRAVKVPVPALDEALRRRFWSEYEVLQKVNDTWKEKFPSNLSPFPHVEKGQIDGREVLVMEFIPQEWSLSAVLKTKTGLDSEKLALEAARQYARLLMVLHTAGYVCLDRKFLDFFFDTGRSRLIVLDWNVVETYTNERVPEEHTTFAALWYQFLSGKAPPDVFDPLDDENWGEISIVTRRVLSDVWWGRYVGKEKDLADRIGNRQKYFNLRVSTPLKLAPGVDQTDYDIDAKWQELELYDLARKVADSQERQKCEDRYNTLRAWFGERFDRFFSETDMALIEGEYKQGLENLKKLDRVAEGDPEIALHRERFHVVLSAGIRAHGERRKFFELTQWLPDVLRMMQRNEVDKCGAKLAEHDSDLTGHPLLEALTIEVAIRRLWDAYNQKQAELRRGEAVSNTQYRDILEILENIERKLGELRERGGERYEQVLRKAVFPHLETLKKQAEERARAEIAFYPPDQGLDPLNYLRFRFRDVHNLDEERIKSLRESLDFWTLITSLVEQTDTRRPIGEALLAGIVERQVNEVLPARVTELVCQEEGDVRSALQTQVAALLKQEQGQVHDTLQKRAADLLNEAFQAKKNEMNELKDQMEGQFRAALQELVKSQLSQAESDVRHALQSQVSEFLSQEENNVRKALQTQIYDYWQREGYDSVCQALQTQVNALLPQEANRVRPALQTQVNQFLSQAESDVRRELQSLVSKFQSQGEEAVRQELQKQVDDLIARGSRQIEDLLDQKKGKFRKDLQEWADNLQREEQRKISEVLQPEQVRKLVRDEFYRLVVQQSARFVEQSTPHERMAIWADDLRFNTLRLALAGLLKSKSRSDIPEELKQQLSVIRESLPSNKSKSYQIDEKKTKEWHDFFDYWITGNKTENSKTSKISDTLAQEGRNFMMQPPQLPDRSPVSKREPQWPIFLSVFTGLGAIVLVIFLILAILAYLDFRQIVLTLNKAPESPTPASTSTAEPTVTPAPVFQFSLQGKFNFDEPIEIAFTHSYLDPNQIEFQLLGSGETNLSDRVKLNNQVDKVTIPAQLLVGQFTLRARLDGNVLADLPIEIRPPQLELSDLIEVRPPLELNNRYILLPNESKIVLKEKYRNNGWSLSMQQPGFLGGSAEITFVGSELSTSSLDLAIKITGAYDSQGSEYQHPVRLPIVKLSLLQNPIGELYTYDILNACDQSMELPTSDKALENISTFAGEVFSISEICEGREVGVPSGYRLVMVIGDINRRTPGTSTSPGLQTFSAPPAPGQPQQGQQTKKPELLKVGDGSKKQSMEPKGVRYLFVREVEAGNPNNPEENLLRIALFGLIKQN